MLRLESEDLWVETREGGAVDAIAGIVGGRGL